MNGKILIIIGGLVLIILLGVWGYLLFFGTPRDAGDVFSDFGFGPDNETAATSTPTEEPEPEPTGTVAKEPLRQLTTRPVAGYIEVSTGTSTPDTLYYAEAGSGHIYTINLDTGEEERVSNTTIPSAHSAVFSEDATAMVARSGFANANDVVVGTRGTSSLNITVLPETILDYTLRGTQLLYLTPITGGAAGRALDVMTFSGRELFTIPFSQAEVQWGATADGAHYVYPKPARAVDGYLYEISNDTLRRLPVSGGGLVAEAGADSVAYSAETNNGVYGSGTINNNGTLDSIGTIILPEKCDFSTNNSTLWCAQSFNVDSDYPDSWYKGLETTSDILWEITFIADEPAISTVLVNFETASGRPIDATNLNIAPDEAGVYFINRIDNTLWTYDL